MPYSHASEHSVTDSLTKTMLFIGNPLVANVGGISCILGDLGDSIFGAVAVTIVYLSSVSGVAGLRIIVLVV